MTSDGRFVVVLPDAALLTESTSSRLLLALLDAQSVEQPVHLVVTGGTIGIACLEAVRHSPLAAAVNWTGVHVWWGDERFLPTGDPERNETQARAALLDHVPIPAGNVHAVLGPDGAASPEESADAYAAELATWAAEGAPAPAFAVLMLGMGPDGHVASLFPGLPGVHASGTAAVGVHGSPKPPPQRVSLTFEAIACAEQAWVVVAGAEKAPMVARALAGAPVDEVPAAGVRGAVRTVWLLDAAAAGVPPEKTSERTGARR